MTGEKEKEKKRLMRLAKRWCGGRLKGDHSGWCVGVSRQTGGHCRQSVGKSERHCSRRDATKTPAHTLSRDLGGFDLGRWAAWRGPLPARREGGRGEEL